MSNEQTVKIDLTVAQTNVILAALAKQPLEAVLDVFNSIQRQANAQLVPAQGEPVVEAPAE